MWRPDMYGQLRKLSAAAPPLVDMSGGKGIFAALLRGPVAAARGARGAERGGKPQPQHSPAVRLLAECRLLLGGDADADQEAAAAAAPRQPAGLASSQQHSVRTAGWCGRLCVHVPQCALAAVLLCWQQQQHATISQHQQAPAASQ
jgi:hypothetical protein